ncbi:hypothetical protein FGO68_gene1299 [Halteria grandinella]|uniref:RING-type domain-containing protein n=1 Tax=Halteria grandinella TaxID=5974 RepID=A0A8J8NM64_HALGN|nr:hypothetical protein FGO68_gene1299 [Halteria grandinella]
MNDSSEPLISSQVHQRRIVRDELFSINYVKNQQKLVWSLLGLLYFTGCLMLFDKQKHSQSDPVNTKCVDLIYKYSVDYLIYILIPLALTRQLLNTCLSNSQYRFLRIHNLVELYECRTGFNIHALNYFLILFTGLRIASIVITVSCLMVCCFPVLLIVCLKAAFTRRQREEVRRELINDIYSESYDKLSTICPNGIPNIDIAECSICLGTFLDNEQQPMKATPLACDTRHVFHTKCIQQWFLTDNSCPLCKAPVTQRDMKNMLQTLKSQQSTSINR